VTISGRLGRVQARLCDLRVDGLLISDLTNVRWLTGFTGSNGWALVDDSGLLLVTDGRYADQAASELEAAAVEGEVRVGLSGAALLGELATWCARRSRVGFEAEHVSVGQHGRWKANFASELCATSGVIERERRTKDHHEIDLIARAATIADQALSEVAPDLAGLTETEVRNRLELRMRELGASGPSYETIVASGPRNAARPHHRPTPTVIETGHTVVIDVGALVDGYHSDMTRSYIVGEPSTEQQRLYDAVLAAQCSGVAAVKAGLPAADLDRVCRTAMADAGYAEWFSHGTGHGVGLLIHEDPFINAHTTDILREGDVVTVEPGAYREGFGGIRVEDLVVVTSEGCRVLTASPKDSPCLPSPPTI
jgi:Xaa-Pro aminopeptidase